MEEVTASTLWRLTTQVDATVALDLGPTIQDDKRQFEAPAVWVTIRVLEVPKSYRGPTIIPLSKGDYPEAVFAVPCPRAEPKAYIPALRELHTYLAAASRPQSGVVLGVGTEKDLEAASDASCRPLKPAAKLDPASLSEARKVVIPIAVTLLCRDGNIDKGVIASHLHRLVALWPNGNPPRAALKRINEFYMSERA